MFSLCLWRWSAVGMLKSFFLKNRLAFAKNRFFSRLSFLVSQWPLVAPTCWAAVRLMQLSRWVVERQAYKQTASRTRLLGLSPVMGTFSQWQRVGEEGRQQRVVNSIVWNVSSQKKYLLDGSGGEGRTHVLSANDLQSHQPPSRPTGQASWRPGHRWQHRGPTVKCQLRWGVSP